MERLKEELRSSNYSEKTIFLYTYFNSKFLDFCKKNYEEVSRDDIIAYLSFLAEKKSSSTVNIAFSALKFFYETVLKKIFFSSIKISKSKKQELLTKEEIEKLANAAATKKSKLIIKMLCFFKTSELVSLKKSDDRIPEELIHELKAVQKDSEYIFPGRKGMMSKRNIQKILSRAAKVAGIQKKVTPHILRLSFKK